MDKPFIIYPVVALCACCLLGFMFLAEPAQAQLTAERTYSAGCSDQSVFRSVWEAILQDAKVRATIKALPAENRRQAFIENKIQLDCCSIPEWRQRPEEMAQQIYTRPIFYTVQFFIHHKDMAFHYKEPKDLAKYRMGVIKGHSLVYEEYFGGKVEAANFKELLELVAARKADIASINEQEFKYQMGQRDWPVVRGPEYHRLPLRARIRIEHEYLLPRLNLSISRLQKSGKIDALIGAAMRAEIYRKN